LRPFSLSWRSSISASAFPCEADEPGLGTPNGHLRWRADRLHRFAGRSRMGSRIVAPQPSPFPIGRRGSGNVGSGEATAGPLPLPIVGGQIARCCLDTAFTLLLDVSAGWWSLRIETAFVLSSPAGSCQRFEASDRVPPSTWGPAVDALLHATVVHATLTRRPAAARLSRWPSPRHPTQRPMGGVATRRTRRRTDCLRTRRRPRAVAQLG
jgi:hypothetical protein